VGGRAPLGGPATRRRWSGVCLVFGHREGQVLRRHELVAEALGLLLRLLQDAAEPRRGADLDVAAYFWLTLKLGRKGGRKLRGLHAEGREDARNDPTGLVD